MNNPSGWDPMQAHWWPMIADSIQKPWPREAVLMDLRWWAARERMGDGSRPGRPSLVNRYGWTDKPLRRLMADLPAWLDPANPVQPRSSGGPAEVQRRSKSITDDPVLFAEKVQAGSSDGPAEVQQRSSRALVHRTPYTDTDTDKTHAADAAPSSATTTDDQQTLDLLASLESRPTVATTIDTPAATDTANTSGGDPCATRTDSEAGGTPSPVPAPPSPVASPQDAGTIPAPEVAPASSAPGAARKGKGKGKGGPSPEAVAAWPAAITWWATLNPSNAGRLKMERGDGAALLKALDSQGVDVIMGRLRQASVGTCYMARQVRGEVPGRDRVDALSTLLWERTGITAPLDSAAEAEGYDTVSAPSYGLASVPGASDVSEHVQTPGALAWADLRAQAWHGPDAQKRWREIERSGPHFVWADGYHLAGERVEHEKRCRAWRAAGGLVGWTDDQRAFQQRFVEAYDAVAVAA